MADEIRSNETTAAGDEHFHEVSAPTEGLRNPAIWVEVSPFRMLRGSLARGFFTIHQPIVHPGNGTPDHKASYETVDGADQTPHKRHPVPDEELAEKGKVRPD